MKNKRLWAGALGFQMLAGPVSTQELPVTVEAEYSEGFGWLSNVRELPDGRVLVADPMGQMLAAIDMDSGELEIWGREGPGPQEYVQPDAVFALPGGRTLLVDLGNGRLTEIGTNGRFEKTHPIARSGGDSNPGRPSRPTMVFPRGVDEDGGVYFTVRSSGNPNDSTTISRLTLSDGEIEPLAKVKPQSVNRGGSGGNVTITSVPMSAQDDWGVAPDGTLALVRSDGYYIEILRPDGTHERGPAQEVELLRPRDEDKYAYLDALASGGVTVQMSIVNGDRQMVMGRGGSRGGQPDIRSQQWPDRMPAFRAGTTEISPDGRIFVGRTVRAGSPSRFDVFDMNGNPAGYAIFGPRATIVGFGEGGAVYVAETDELGLVWLKRVRVG